MIDRCGVGARTNALGFRRWCLPLIEYGTYIETIVNVSEITDHMSNSETKATSAHLHL